MRWMTEKAIQSKFHQDKEKSTRSFNKRSPTVHMHLTLADITSKEELDSLCADLRKNNGDCPCC